MKKVIHITGMSCGHCSARVQKALAELDGAVSATVDHVSGQAVFEGDVSDEALTTAVQNAGYEVTSIDA